MCVASAINVERPDIHDAAVRIIAVGSKAIPDYAVDAAVQIDGVRENVPIQARIHDIRRRKLRWPWRSLLRRFLNLNATPFSEHLKIGQLGGISPRRSSSR